MRALELLRCWAQAWYGRNGRGPSRRREIRYSAILRAGLRNSRKSDPTAMPTCKATGRRTTAGVSATPVLLSVTMASLYSIRSMDRRRPDRFSQRSERFPTSRSSGSPTRTTMVTTPMAPRFSWGLELKSSLRNTVATGTCKWRPAWRAVQPTRPTAISARRSTTASPRRLVPATTVIAGKTSYHYGGTVVELLPIEPAHTWGDILVHPYAVGHVT